jgi:acyl dehydratase
VRDDERAVVGVATTIPVAGPWFEDLHVGQVFDDAPAITLTAGHAMLHQALTGDRLRLPLDASLTAAVTGDDRLVAHPTLVCNVAIGATTAPSQRVRGNLFYRGMVLRRPVHLGDTLRTVTEVVGLKQNRKRPDRPATGLAALRMHVTDQHDRTVLDCWRCPMLPLRDQHADTGHTDSFDEIPAELDPDEVAAAIPPDWDLAAFRDRHRSPAPDTATTYEVEARDTVTAAPELARATLNLAQTHTDADASVYGRRLVYGGHTIALAGAQLTRAVPDLVTILAWRSCDHLAPVFEGDLVASTVEVEATQTAGRDADGGARLLDLRVRTLATTPAGGAGHDDTPRDVLDWRLVGLHA